MTTLEGQVAVGALLEVGYPHLAAAVSVRERDGIAFPTFIGSIYGFGLSGDTMSPDEKTAASRAFTLAHQVHDRAAHVTPTGIWCPTCQAVYERLYGDRGAE